MAERQLLQPAEQYSAEYVAWATSEGESTSTHVRRGRRLNPGFVTLIANEAADLSIVDLERAASIVEAKGVILERGTHTFSKQIEKWVSQQEDDDDCCSFAKEALQISKQQQGQRKKRMSNAPETVEACHRLVSRLPASFRASVLADALELTESLTNMCLGVPYLMLQLEVIGNNRCCRWHQDQYAGRMLITYAGPSTWMCNDQDVNFGMFDQCIGVPSELSDPLIVPDYARIHKPPANTVILIKGNEWPGIEHSTNSQGVVHKSPNMRMDKKNGNPVVTRFALKVDLSYRPPF